MKNNHAVIICVESVFIEDLIVAFVSSKAFSRQRSGTKHNRWCESHGKENIRIQGDQLVTIICSRDPMLRKNHTLTVIFIKI